jgi:hypothetical protein
MTRTKWVVTKTDETISGHTEVWLVNVPNSPGYNAVAVWRDIDTGICRCTACSGLLVAMLSTCVHAQAVKRKAAKTEP